MGFTGLARWVNAPTSGLQLVRDNIMFNHNGQFKGRWQLSVRSYRSTLQADRPPSDDGKPPPPERTMCALTMDNNVFVLIDDPAQPSAGEAIARAKEEEKAGNISEADYLQLYPHFRTTFLTLRPPGALEQLLSQLKARWASVRQSSANAPQRNQGVSHQLMIDGHIFSIGTDWLVRVGTVMLAGGAVKGMLLEAEYLPLPVLHSTVQDGTSELLSNLLTSVLPNVPDAKTLAVTIPDHTWKDTLWNREETRDSDGESMAQDGGDDDIYAYDDEDPSKEQHGDWTGIDRDRRSAYLIMGALKSEGIL